MERWKPVVLHLPSDSRLTLFVQFELQFRLLSRFLTPPLNLIRLSVVIPFAGIGPRLIFYGVRLFEMEIHPPNVLPLSWRPSHIMPMSTLLDNLVVLTPSVSLLSPQLSCPTNSCQLGIMRPDLFNPQNCQIHWLLER